MGKAQGGLNAAVLVAIIAGIIVIYILFLPTEDRKDLLEDGTGSPGTPSSSNKIVLLSENVGRLDPVGNVKDKDLPNVMIFETTNSKVLEELNPISVRNGWFDKKSKTVALVLDNFENIDNIALSFSAPKRQGILSIILNGNLLYEYDINNINIEPIKIKKSLLKKDNEFEFSVSGVGSKFWTTNEYALENVKLIGDITDLSRQESKNIFTMTDTEYQNLEKSEMKFIPYCTTSTSVGVLDVFVNDRNIFSAVPVCNDLYKQEIPPSSLSAGQNKIIFKTSKGSYSIEQIKLSFKEKDTPEAVYYFEANSTTIKKITDNDYDAFLRIRFVDDENAKRADLNINDHLVRIDQLKKTYERNLNTPTNWLEEGNNFIKITPKTTLDISEIKVELEKK